MDIGRRSPVKPPMSLSRALHIRGRGQWSETMGALSGYGTTILND